jgi:hypothetical protein
MPFTLAHPAIILPLSQSKRFSLTALIAGSMVPDFEFFFQMREVENIGHHWMGIILFDVPVALVFCFFFHGLLRNLLIANLPTCYRNRFIQHLNFNWNRFAAENKWKLICSVFIGVLTHILWDGVTHNNGLFVMLLPVLNAKIQILYFQLPVYFLLQMLFSLSGMFLMLFAVHQLPIQNRNVTADENNKMYWPMLLFILFIILIIRFAGWPEYNNFWSVVMALMGGITYALLLTSFLFKK